GPRAPRRKGRGARRGRRPRAVRPRGRGVRWECEARSPASRSLSAVLELVRDLLFAPCSRLPGGVSGLPRVSGDLEGGEALRGAFEEARELLHRPRDCERYRTHGRVDAVGSIDGAIGDAIN